MDYQNLRHSIVLVALIHAVADDVVVVILGVGASSSTGHAALFDDLAPETGIFILRDVFEGDGATGDLEGAAPARWDAEGAIGNRQWRGWWLVEPDGLPVEGSGAVGLVVNGGYCASEGAG